MMAILATPVPVKELGLVMLKLGNHIDAVIPKDAGGRVLLTHAPVSLDSHPPGLVNIPFITDESPLLTDDRLFPLWDELIKNEYYQKELNAFISLKQFCQFSTEECHKELVLRKVNNSLVRMCWAHDNELANDEAMVAVARRNLISFWIVTISKELRLPAGNQLSIPELCWWLTLNGWIKKLPDQVVRAVLDRPDASFKKTPIGLKSTDDLYRCNPGDEIVQKTSPVKEFISDPEPPAMYMLRPKPIHWECSDYLRYVKALPCVCCGKQSDDPHHLIGNGQGKMGGKAHDLFVIPVCRQDHNELHRDVASWERKHGSQISHVIKTLDRALKEGALV